MNWIWQSGEGGNVYVEFTDAFTANGKDKVTLTVGSDYEYAAYINGALASMGQYSDGSGIKTVESVDITSFTVKGNNEIRLIAHHIDKDYSICCAGEPCAAYLIESGGKVLAQSGRHTKCAVSRLYYDLDNCITVQCGIGFGYDFTAAENRQTAAAEVNLRAQVCPRPVKSFTLTPPLDCEVCSQGVFKQGGGVTAAEQMQLAYLSPRRFGEMTSAKRPTAANLSSPLTFVGDGGDGIYVLVDLKRETAGYLTLSIDADCDCNAVLGWGEHLCDLRPRTYIGGRNFAAPVKLKKGRNEICDDLHRIGCRYLMLYAYSHRITVNAMSLREAVYPFADIKKDFGDRLLNKIYEVGKRTLQLCAHVHYEDCVWREQALYAMDSRNQMLFGYGVFGEYDLPRASLNTIARSIADDGLPELCPPSRNVITIPSFALYYILALGENARADYNAEFICGSLPYARKMFDSFSSRLTDKGVGCFTGTRYWNFYEWVDGLDGGAIFRDKEIEQTQDAILTALLALCGRKLAYLYNLTGDTRSAEQCKRTAAAAAASLENFYDGESGLYCSFTDAHGNKSGYHCYTQAVALMAGVPENRRKTLVAALKNPPDYVKGCTFATMQWKYDAIMTFEPDLDFCLNEICSVFGKMIYGGATSYYETELGEADFEDAGSLCHAWSAVPCYFFNKYLKQVN